MNLSYNWLKELVEIDLSAEDLSLKLTHAGCSIEDIVDVAGDKQIVAEVTTNRPDWLCHNGAAHEIAAITGKTVKLPEFSITETGEDVNTLAKVTVTAEDLCPRYTARVIKGVTVKESPDWLKQKLEAVGLRPINNIVDITNFVLYEMNQPLHAFDYDLLEGHEIIVRRANKNEKIIALDETECKLTPEMLVIADAKKPVAIAGVMGGSESEVSEKTTNILLESAYFESKQVRRTSRGLKLESDSSYRFERGIDPGGVERASARACQLIMELAGGELATGIIDTKPDLAKTWEVTMRLSRCTKILGVEFAVDEVEKVFTGLGLETVSKSDEEITVTIPTFRQDLTREIDMIEEVIRVIGYERLPDRVSMPLERSHEPLQVGGARMSREVLTGLGYNECQTDPFVPEKWLADFPCLGTPVRVLNPINTLRPVLRTSLIPSLLDVRRVNRETQDVRLFEIGRVYLGEDRGGERIKLAICDDRGVEYVRGALETLLRRLRVKETLALELASDLKMMQEGSAAMLKFGDETIGVMGMINNTQAKLHDLHNPVAVLIADLALIVDEERIERDYKPLPKFPGVGRDIAIVVGEEIKWEEIEKIIAADMSFVDTGVGVKLESIYRGKGIDKGKKSVAFSIVYRNDERSMTDDEANDLRDKLVSRLTSKIDGAALRA